MSARDSIEQLQMRLCDKYDAPYRPLKMDELIGVSRGVLNGQHPLNGLRHPSTDTTSGWYIWSGDYSDKQDFFTSVHVQHLFEQLPELIPYLGLPPSWRFLIDPAQSYEDVWRDVNLLDVEE